MAAQGVGKAVGRTAQGTLSPERVLKSLRDAGLDVESLADLRRVDLERLDEAARFGRLRHAYALTAMVEGGAPGLAVTGGVTAAVPGGLAGAGAGAAPGLATVAAATAGDAAAVLTLAARVVSHTAMYYGYDPKRPEEQVFLMSCRGTCRPGGLTCSRDHPRGNVTSA